MFLNVLDLQYLTQKTRSAYSDIYSPLVCQTTWYMCSIIQTKTYCNNLLLLGIFTFTLFPEAAILKTIHLIGSISLIIGQGKI